MIKLEIITSPDELISGKFDFYGHELIIGRNSSCHLVIDDSEIKNQHLSLKKNEHLLFIHSSKNTFFLNGKKIIGTKAYQVNDILTLGETSIKLLSYDLLPQSKGSKILERYNETIEQDPELESIFKEIDREIIFLEKEVNVTKSSQS